MEYTQFIEEICQRAEACVAEGTQVEMIHTERNNGTLLYGITIRSKECNWAPTIYLEKFYMDYMQGVQMDTILGEIMELYEEKRNIELPDLSFLQDYKKAKKRLALKIVHYGRNRNFLKGVPHKPFWNLAIIVYCRVTEIENAQATINITNEHMKMWKVKKEELFKDALRNAQETMPCHIRTMSEVLKEFMSYDDTYDDQARKVLEKQSNAMLIMSNHENFYGASCILYDGVLQHLADCNKTSYYILPSSVHEVILLPQELAEYPSELKNMVKEINRTQVEPEEVLSDEIYFFDRLSGKIMQV